MSENRVVWKFDLNMPNHNGEVFVQTPRFARPLHVDADGSGYLCVWMEVDPDEPLVRRVFHVRGTGHGLTGKEGWHIGSAVMPSGIAWHVYDQQNPAATR